MKIISWNVNGIRSNIIDSTTAKNKSIRNLELDSPLGQIIQ
jgi:exonuclease III